MVTLMENGNLAAIHAKRVTIMPKDIQLVMKMLHITKAYKTDTPVTGIRADPEPSKDERDKALKKIKAKRQNVIVSESESEEETPSNKKYSRILNESDFESQDDQGEYSGGQKIGPAAGEENSGEDNGSNRKIAL